VTGKRRVPQHLTGAVKDGKRSNARIREIIRKLSEGRERDLALIYQQLNLIANETIQCDRSLDQIETGTREAVRAWNAQ